MSSVKIVEFLNARLDEDERSLLELVDHLEASSLITAPLTEPLLMLRIGRDITAKRGVVKEMEAARKNIAGRGLNVPFFVTWTLMHLACAYREHPDFVPEWGAVSD